MQWASSPSSQSGACAWKRWASSRVSGGTPPRQGVHVFSARVSVMFLSPRPFLAANTTATSLSIDLAEHDVERTDDRRDVGSHVPASLAFRRPGYSFRRRSVAHSAHTFCATHSGRILL